MRFNCRLFHQTALSIYINQNQSDIRLSIAQDIESPLFKDLSFLGFVRLHNVLVYLVEISSGDL